MGTSRAGWSRSRSRLPENKNERSAGHFWLPGGFAAGGDSVLSDHRRGRNDLPYRCGLERIAATTRVEAAGVEAGAVVRSRTSSEPALVPGGERTGPAVFHRHFLLGSAGSELRNCGNGGTGCGSGDFVLAEEPAGEHESNRAFAGVAGGRLVSYHQPLVFPDGGPRGFGWFNDAALPCDGELDWRTAVLVAGHETRARPGSARSDQPAVL